MVTVRQPARINYMVLFLTLVIAGVLFAGAWIGHRVQKRIAAQKSLREGLAAYDRQDWGTACTNLGRYIVRYPEDVDVLEKLAHAQISVRPLDSEGIKYAIFSYRNLMRLNRRPRCL